MRFYKNIRKIYKSINIKKLKLNNLRSAYLSILPKLLI